MIPVAEDVQIVVAAHGHVEAERICTTDALAQFWPKTLLLIPTPRLLHLKPGSQVGTMVRMMAVTGAPLITNQARLVIIP